MIIQGLFGFVNPFSRPAMVKSSGIGSPNGILSNGIMKSANRSLFIAIKLLSIFEQIFFAFGTCVTYEVLLQQIRSTPIFNVNKALIQIEVHSFLKCCVKGCYACQKICVHGKKLTYETMKTISKILL